MERPHRVNSAITRGYSFDPHGRPRQQQRVPEHFVIATFSELVGGCPPSILANGLGSHGKEQSGLDHELAPWRRRRGYSVTRSDNGRPEPRPRVPWSREMFPVCSLPRSPWRRRFGPGGPHLRVRSARSCWPRCRGGRPGGSRTGPSPGWWWTRDREPVEGARLELAGFCGALRGGERSGGGLPLPEVQVGSYAFRVEHLAYGTVTSAVEVSADEETVVRAVVSPVRSCWRRWR